MSTSSISLSSYIHDSLWVDDAILLVNFSQVYIFSKKNRCKTNYKINNSKKSKDIDVYLPNIDGIVSLLLENFNNLLNDINIEYVNIEIIKRKEFLINDLCKAIDKVDIDISIIDKNDRDIDSNNIDSNNIDSKAVEGIKYIANDTVKGLVSNSNETKENNNNNQIINKNGKNTNIIELSSEYALIEKNIRLAYSEEFWLSMNLPTGRETRKTQQIISLIRESSLLLPFNKDLIAIDFCSGGGNILLLFNFIYF
jgi:hypothetical protein